MSTLHPFLIALGLSLGASATCASETLDSLRPDPIPVRLVLTKAADTCLRGLSESDLLTRMGSALTAGGQILIDSEASAQASLSLDTASGHCDLALEFRDSLGQSAAHFPLRPHESVAESDRIERLGRKLGLALEKERSALIDVRTSPPGSRVRLNGQIAGVTPLHLEGLRTGPMLVSVEQPGWSSLTDSIVLCMGRLGVFDRKLERSATWLDSVRQVRVSLRHDSLWKAAKAHPARGLAELYDHLASGLTPKEEEFRVAILPFEVSGAAEENYDPGVMAAEFGMSRWSTYSRIQIIERDSVRKLMKVSKFAHPGSAPDSCAARMGWQLRVHYLVTGTIRIENGKQVFTARLVSMKSGEVVAASVTEMPSKEMEGIYRQTLLEKGLMGASLRRSLAIPGWGQFHTNHPVHASLSIAATALAAGWAVVAGLDYFDKDDDLQRYRDHMKSTLRPGEQGNDWIARAEALRADRNDAALRFDLSLGLLGVVWAANVVDAAMLGRMESNILRARYFTYAPSPSATPQGIALAWRF